MFIFAHQYDCVEITVERVIYTFFDYGMRILS